MKEFLFKIFANFKKFIGYRRYFSEILLKKILLANFWGIAETPGWWYSAEHIPIYFWSFYSLVQNTRNILGG